MICFKCRKAIDDKERSLYGLHNECFVKWFNLPDSIEFSNLSRRDSGSDETNNEPFSEFNSSFFQGKFKKYSASLNGFDYILKVEENEYPELPATEFLCNEIARFFKLKVPEFYLIDFHGKRTFVSKNFINKNKMMALHHIYHYFEKGELFDVNTLVKIIEKQTGQISEVERFIRLCLFDALIGNHDRHGRNLAFLEEANGQTVLSPFYDNPTYIGVEDEMLLGAQHNPKGKIATTKTNEPTMKDYVAEFIENGHKTLVQEFMDGIDLEKLRQIVSESFISQKRKAALMKIIYERTMELKNALKN